MVLRAVLIFAFISFGMANVAQSPFSNDDLLVEDCRIKGITLVRSKASSTPFNYTTAKAVCQQLGLLLANRSDIEEARLHGFETCSFGWTGDGVAVISRNTPVNTCGQGKTGVLPWAAPLSRGFSTYCYNSSDTWINSCKPDPVPPTSTTTSTTMSASTSVVRSDSATATTISILKTIAGAEKTVQVTKDHQTAAHIPVTTESPVTIKTSVPISTTPSSLQGLLTTVKVQEETSAQPSSKGALKSDQVIFGGLPTALLVLALIFFVAAVALAVCYVRKYKTTLHITSTSKQPENVEVKVLNEPKTSTNSSKEEHNQNGKPTEGTQSKPPPSETSASKPPTVDTSKNQPAAAETTKSKPAAVDAAKNQPAAVETTKSKPPAVDAAKNQPAAVETTKSKPPAVDAAKNQPAAVETTKSKPPAVDAAKNQPAAAETAKSKLPAAEKSAEAEV
ncbi:lymphatic vessel endothelial hyaluronic acid receptor 1 [Ambystoma mexicanum]|uniref:lymphatic vessel endothelial hyaluronic acid receptor 1 n=1 Tax=Ambystoma mexicanum TaxID=8296 RepID=UPI0037E8F817